MIGPVQNSPLPLEPARQQLSPPSPLVTLPPQPLPPAEQPLPAATTPRDKFSEKDDGRGAEQDSARQQQQYYENTKALNSAWVRLTALQHIAREALGAGNGPQAAQAAVEAASVAASIRDIADSLPGVSIDGIDVPAAIDNARGGLGTALDVVHLADQIRNHSVSDRTAIGGARDQVVKAIAGVEAVAAELLPSSVRLATQFARGLDLRA